MLSINSPKLKGNNLLMTISYSRRVIGSLSHVASIETGHLAEEFSTTKRRLSWFGSMRRIN